MKDLDEYVKEFYLNDGDEVPLKYQKCPQCKKYFQLRWKDYNDNYSTVKETLIIRSCPSGGIYDVSIECPYCDYEEEL